MSVWLALAHAIDRLIIVFRRIKEILMSNLDTLQASVERLGGAVRDGVPYIATLREKLAVQEAEIRELRIALTNAGEAEQLAIADRLAALTASIDADVDALVQAVVIPVVEDPQVPTEDVEVPPSTNPDTVDPGTVDGSVPAGDPAPAPEV